MIDRLISMNALRKEVERNFDMQNLYLPVHILNVAEDVEEGIVRCKDCVHYNYHTGCKRFLITGGGNEWFCADGRKKDG